MTKAHLIDQIADQLVQQLNTLLHASEQAYQSATHSESKAENKYDTLGLEAAYLAHGLSVRVQQAQLEIAAWRQWQPPTFGANDTIALGALVVLESDAGDEKIVLLAAQGGGLTGTVDRGDVTVVTAAAPLGLALLGKQLDDEVVLDIAGVRSDYTVVGLE
ncbi:MAG: transcription elongation factor GreAB [Halopseudomonas sp.]